MLLFHGATADLKEGKNWTEEVLFQQCHFNIQVRCALALGVPSTEANTKQKTNLKATVISQLNVEWRFFL